MALRRSVRGERLQPQSLEAEDPVARADLVRRPRTAALDARRPPPVRHEAGAVVAPVIGYESFHYSLVFYMEMLLHSQAIAHSSPYLLHLLPASTSER